MLRKQIGIDVTSAMTQGGGIGRYTRELVQAFVHSAYGQTVDLRLFSARPPASLPVADPLPQAANVTHLPSRFDERWLYRLWYRLRLPIPVQVTTGKLDLFHSPDFVLPPVSGRIPTLLTVHDLSFVHFPHVYPQNLVSYLNQVVPWSIARATHVLADSEATKADLIRTWQVPDSKITVLLSGVHERFHPSPDQDVAARRIREKYRLGDRPYILAVGTVQPRKNYRMLIRAFAGMADQLPHNLVIAGGKGWLYDEILTEAGQLGVQDRVIFAGFVDDDDLPRLYEGSAVYVFPSLYEGFGLPILEAMGCGVPVINSNASCLPEVAGEATIQLAPTDEDGWRNAMLRILTDEQKRQGLITAGFDQVQRFSWARSAEQLAGVYRKLLDS